MQNVVKLYRFIDTDRFIEFSRDQGSAAFYN